MKNEKWFELELSQIEKKLKTNAASGLSRKAARSRAQRKAGDSELFHISKHSPLKLILEMIADPALIILLLAASVSLFFEFEEIRNGLTVLVLIIFELGVVGYMYYRSSHLLSDMEAFFYPTVRVIREGRIYNIDFRSVVVGDVILVEEGDILCCDARLITSDALRVKMRVDKDVFVSLEKMSDGYVNPNEYRASEMVNMLHAGSVVESGSARAIAVAVGRYTYLGARTGGIDLPESQKSDLPDMLRKQCSKINMAMLIAVLPFSLIGLLVSYFSGGTVLLSSAFLTALAIAATTASPLLCVLFKLFYAARIRKLAKAPSGTVIRSAKTIERLADADLVFMLDGCAVTDGILHFDSAICCEGEINNYDKLNMTARRLSELVALYKRAAENTLTVGISGFGEYFVGMNEFIRKSKVDTGALKIRCSVESYVSGNIIDTPERLCFVDGSKKFYLNVSSSVNAIRDCTYVMSGGKKQPFGDAGKTEMEKILKKQEGDDKRVLIFTLSEDSFSSGACFVGMISMREGIDADIEKNVKMIERLGCKVISFYKRSNAPAIPSALRYRVCMSKQDVVKNKLPLTYDFGNIRSYIDFEYDDIIALVKYAQAKGQQVAVIGFSEEAANIGKTSGCFISCTPLCYRTSGYLDEEILKVETAGRQYSTSCTQSVKEKAGMLIPRPSFGNGGLISFIGTLLNVKIMYTNLSVFLEYSLLSQIIRVIVTALPMIFGQTFIDARHLLVCTTVIDILVFASLCFGTMIDAKRGDTARLSASSLKEHLTIDPSSVIAATIAALSVLLLPTILGYTGLVGQYHYKIDFTFTALILLHWTVRLVTFGAFSKNGSQYSKNAKASKLKKIFYDKFFIAETIFCVVLLILCYVWQPLGVVFDMQENPLPYLILSFVPSVLFVTLCLYIRKIFDKRSSDDHKNRNGNKRTMKIK